MPGHGIGFANKLLLLIFNGVTIPNIADNAASGPLTNFYVSLHIADPLRTGNQTSHECAYTSYARVAVARTSGGWAIGDNTLFPTNDIVFPMCTGGSELATHMVIGTDATGVGNLMYFSPLDPHITISNTIVPKIRGTSSVTEN